VDLITHVGIDALEKVGCEVVSGGALDTKGRVNKMLEVRATCGRDHR